MLQIGIWEAQGLAADPTTSSPYAVLAAGKERFKSQGQKGSDPVWEEAFNVSIESAQKIYVTVWNKQPGQDAFLGLASVDIELMTLDGAKKWFPLSGRRGKNDVVSGEICVSCVDLGRPSPTPKSQQKKQQQPTPKEDPKLSKQGQKEAKQKVTSAISAGSNDIDLSGLNLSSVPDALLSYHKNWNNLDLGFNKFYMFPSGLYNFQALEELWLTGNQIPDIPDDISLPSLRILYLNGNKLDRIPPSIVNLNNLEKLDVANNQIAVLPDNIGELRKLAELFLSGNPLGSVPPSMGHLEFLEILDLSSCELRSLPDEFPGMGRLLELNLGNNQISKLPTEFGKMSRLVSLNLCDNKLTDLPISMGACAHLDSVILDRNPIKDPDLLRKYEIGTDHLLDYLGKRLFAQSQVAKKKQREAAKKAGNKLREDIQRDKQQSGGIQDAPHSTLVLEDEGFEEIEEDDDAHLSPEEKYAKIRAHSQKLATECRNEVVTLKRALMKASQLEDIVPIAKAIRNLIPHMNVARQQMAPIPKPQPPMFMGNEDKVTQLKKTTAVAIREFETVLNGIFNVVSGNATLEQLVPLSGVITGSLSILQEVTKNVEQ